MKISKLVGGRENLNALMKLLRFIPDKLYLQVMYFCRMRKCLDVHNPQTFNEKLQWLKLYDRLPQYTTMVDKYEAKRYVEANIGGKYVIPTLGVWNRFDDIDFEALPESFVLKCTHDSGGLVICKDKREFNKKEARQKIEKSLQCNFYWVCREWPYKDIKPRIIAEKYMKDADNENLPVYKFFCFNGVPKIIQAIQNDKKENETVDYFDTSWKKLNLRQNFPNSELPLSKPDRLEEMLKIVSELSKGRSFLRVDLYLINNSIYFSEFTFFSDAGMARFKPKQWDLILGSWIQLPESIQE